MRAEINTRFKHGFTIVELSLSIAFIAILSILVVLIISNAVSSYHRGITLNQLNTVGMDVVDDMRMAVQDSSARSAVKMCGEIYENTTIKGNCERDNGMTLVMAERTGPVKIGNRNETNVPLFGAFCTGGYSYVWNSGYFFSDDYTVSKGNNIGDGANLVYKIAGSDTVHNWRNEHDGKNFKLLKVKDENRLVCRAAAKNLNSNSSGYYLTNSGARSNLRGDAFDISANNIEEEPTDVLEGSSNLAIYDLTSALPAESGESGNMFYSVSFILGTVQGGINVMSSGSYCATPEGQNQEVENFDYCAINKFNFAAQATGG